MAALSKVSDIHVRAAAPGEGRLVAALWRELWDAHEAWGGYPGSHDERVYARPRRAGSRRTRASAPGAAGPRAPRCTSSRPGKGTWRGRSRGGSSGTGSTRRRRTRARCARSSCGGSCGPRGSGARSSTSSPSRRGAWGRGGAVVLAAEVLEPNPAHAFYAKCAYTPVSYNQRIVTSLGAAAPVGGQGMGARPADPKDALAIALLESTLAARRRAAGDDALRSPARGGRDARRRHRCASGAERGGGAVGARRRRRAGERARAGPRSPSRSSSLRSYTLKRAILGRFAVDPACDAAMCGACVAALVALGSRLAAARGAPTMELDGSSIGHGRRCTRRRWRRARPSLVARGGEDHLVAAPPK